MLLKRQSSQTRQGGFRAALPLLCFALFAISSQEVRAEKYLSVAEVKELCFPGAERFETQAVDLNSDAAKRVLSEVGLKEFTGRTPEIIFAYQGTEFIGAIALHAVIGKHELIDYAVSIRPDGSVGQIEILEYRESHGGQVRGKKWRRQFEGKNANSALKLNRDIYNISGATMSCRHVTEGVKSVLAAFEVVRRASVAPGRELRASAAPR